MANNPYVNKVQKADGTTIIDISDTTATAAQIMQGYGAYGADGAWMDGTATEGIPTLIGRASGSVVNFTDPVGGEPLRSLIVSIEPAQAGSGDPSPTNVRTISGWTEANVTSAGKNLFVDLEEGYYGGNGAISAASATQQEKRTDAYVELGDNTSITFSIQTASASAQWAAVVYYDKNKTFLSRVTYSSSGSVTTAENVFSSFPTGAYYARFCARTYGSSDVQFLFKTVATTAFGQTVYGGTLTLAQDGSAVLSVELALHTVSASELQSVGTTAAGVKYLQPVGNTIPTGAVELASNIYLANATLTSGTWRCLNGRYYIYDNRFTDLATATQIVQSEPIQLLYQLATPVTYQLTSAEMLTTLLGENNIWADCGEVSLEYWKNPILRDEIQAMIDAAVFGVMGGSY